MAIITDGTGTPNDPANEGPSFMFEMVDFLRTNSSWTVAGSGNNSSGGMGSDVITTQADLQTNVSWFVLEDPDSTVHLLFSRVGATDTSWRMDINPDADYSGGGAATLPTNSGGNALQIWSATLIGSGTSRFHILCEDGGTTATAGWLIFQHASGNFATVQGSLAFIPLVNGPVSNTHPFLFCTGTSSSAFSAAANLINESVTAGQVGAWGINPGSSTVTKIPGLQYNQGSTIVLPNSTAQDASARDLTFPIVFNRRSALSPSGYKGTSDFMRWNGTTRTNCDTLASQTRIVFGDCNFPWDGTSTPTDS